MRLALKKKKNLELYRFFQQPPQTFFEVGCDRSLNLSSIAASRGFNALGADALSLPFRDAAFDAVISIAVVHHLTTPERRAAAVAEMLRVARPGGQILVTVWAFEQRRKKEGKSKYLGNDGKEGCDGRFGDVDIDGTKSGSRLAEVKAEIPTSIEKDENDKNANCLNVANLEIHENRTDFKQQDLLVPWHFKAVNQKKLKQTTTSTAKDDSSDNVGNPERVFHRYYHVFKEGELEAMVQSIDAYDVKLLHSYYDQGNWGVIFRKL